MFLCVVFRWNKYVIDIQFYYLAIEVGLYSSLLYYNRLWSFPRISRNNMFNWRLAVLEQDWINYNNGSIVHLYIWNPPNAWKLCRESSGVADSFMKYNTLKRREETLMKRNGSHESRYKLSSREKEKDNVLSLSLEEKEKEEIKVYPLLKIKLRFPRVRSNMCKA